MADQIDEQGEEEASYWAAKRSRRHLLQLAGVGTAAGAAALVVGGASPASAANGDTALVGNNNTGTSSTEFTCTSGLSAGVIGNGTGSGSPGVVGTGTGAGDVKCSGTGRLAQLPAVTGNVEPSWSPQANIGNTLYYHELVRSDTGVLWGSRGAIGDSGNQWKRINAVRVDTASGNGNPFVPTRVVDTRVGNHPLSSGGVRTVAVAGTGSGASAIPADAIAIFGNLTAVPTTASGFPNSGYLSLYPHGVARPTPSNLNPVKGGSVASNFFFCGLGGGSIDVYSYITTHFILDVFAYVQ